MSTCQSRARHVSGSKRNRSINLRMSVSLTWQRALEQARWQHAPQHVITVMEMMEQRDRRMPGGDRDQRPEQKFVAPGRDLFQIRNRRVRSAERRHLKKTEPV